MKKSIIILSSLFLTLTMQAQDRTQPKSGPAPTINIKKPQSFTLPNGLKVLVVENHKLPRVSYSLTIDNAPFAQGSKKGALELTSGLIGNGSTKTSKNAFNEEIDFLGANINFSVSGASANGLSKYAGRILELMAEGALNPNFTQVEFEKDKEKLIEGLKTQEKNVGAVAERVENVLIYSNKHPYGEYLTEESINKVTLEDIKQNYNRFFVPDHAYLVIVGDVKFKDIQKSVEKLFSTWTKATAPRLTYTNPKNVQYTQINFVDMPNAVQSEISLINTVNLKISDPDFFAVTLANQILGGDFNGYLNMNLREAHGWTYGAYSSIGTDRFAYSKFKANTQVRNSVTDSAVVEFLKEIRRIRGEKVTDEVLNNVKAGFIGSFVMKVEKPATIARFALNTEIEGLPADFYENYIKNISAVTPEDIQRVTNKYFLADNLRIQITGKGSEVIPGLEKLKIPMFYYDKFGNPIDKPVSKKPVPAGVTTKTVLDNYIKAIGGNKAVAAVKTIIYVGTAEFKQSPKPLQLTIKKDNKGNCSNSIEIVGMMELSKYVLNDKYGYNVTQGQRKDMSKEEYAEAKINASTFEELLLAQKSDVVLDGIESINGNDAYAIKSGKLTFYYDVKSGLKVQESKNVEKSGQKMTLTTNYADYKTVKGVKIPHQIILNQGIELDFKMTEIKINEGFNALEFQ